MYSLMAKAFGLAFLAVLALILIPRAADGGFAVHLAIVAIAAFAAVAVSLHSADDAIFLGIAKRPNSSLYDDDPIRWGVIATLFWGIAGFARRPLHRAPARLPGAQPQPRIYQLRAAAAAAHLGGDLRLRRQCADRDQLLRRPAHLPRAARLSRRSPASSSGATSCSSCWRRPATCSASPRAREYAEPEWYVDLWLTIVWVAYLRGLRRHDRQAPRAAHLRRQLVLPRASS